MRLIDNERTKLLANSLDRPSTACFTVGVATPLAGYLYGLVSFSVPADAVWLALTGASWLSIAITTFMGEKNSQRVEAMSYNDPMFWFTSLGLPAIIAIGAYIAVRQHERSLKR